MKKSTLVFTVIYFALLTQFNFVEAQQYGPFLQEEFDFVKLQVDQGIEPWESAYNQIMGFANAAQSHTPEAPVEMIYPEGYYLLIEDSEAALHSAMAYKFTGETKYADKAIEILNEWSKCTEIRDCYYCESGSPHLNLSYRGAALIWTAHMLEDYSGWLPADKAEFDTNYAEGTFYKASAIEEEINNWGQWGILARTSVDLYLDNFEILEDYDIPRIKEQIRGVINQRGELPHETSRNNGTSGAHYTFFSINSLSTAAKIASYYSGENIFEYRNCMLYHATHYELVMQITGYHEGIKQNTDNYAYEMMEGLGEVYQDQELIDYAAPHRPIYTAINGWVYPTLMRYPGGLVGIGDTDLHIAVHALFDAFINEDYTFHLASFGGKFPYSYQIKSGSLPSGISLSSSGEFSGQATEEGEFSFTVEVADDDNNIDEQSYTLRVYERRQEVGITDLKPSYLGTGILDSKEFASTLKSEEFITHPAYLHYMPTIYLPDFDAEKTGDFYMSFEINEYADIYVAYNTKTNLPEWLESWELMEGDSIITLYKKRPDYTYYIYKKTWSPGTVVLGANKKTSDTEGDFSTYKVIATKAAYIDLSNEINVSEVTLSEHDISLNIGDNKELIALVSPENASDRSYYYTSEDASIASVSEAGEITALGVGTVDIVVTSNDGGISDTCHVVVEGTTDIKGVNVKSLHFYPNPTNGKIYFSSDTEINDGDMFIVYDLQGKQVEKISIKTGEEQVLDLSHLNKGMYFISLISDSITRSFKVVIE